MNIVKTVGLADTLEAEIDFTLLLIVTDMLFYKTTEEAYANILFIYSTYVYSIYMLYNEFPIESICETNGCAWCRPDLTESVRLFLLCSRSRKQLLIIRMN
jgi:hypothetical protein